MGLRPAHIVTAVYSQSIMHSSSRRLVVPGATSPRSPQNTRAVGCDIRRQSRSSEKITVVPLGTAAALMSVSADEPPGLHVALAFDVDEPGRLGEEVVGQELPGGTGDLDLV